MTITEEDVPPPAVISDHPAHRPRHKLKRVANDGRFFVCDGCMEPGAGTRYRCEHERCNFDLHTCCAIAPDTLTHPMFGDHRVFVFLQEIEPPPAPATTAGGGTKGSGKFRVCVACGKDVRGFVYHCFHDNDDDDDAGLDLHPCCARLPEHAILNDRLPAARHRQWAGAGRQTGVRDASPEQAQVTVRVSEFRQEAPRSSDTSDDRNRGRQRRAPAARHRWWKR